jgi:chloramphenicol-sensitive protein RarD
MIAFPMIWAALVIYTVSLVRQSLRRRPTEVVAADPV